MWRLLEGGAYFTPGAYERKYGIQKTQGIIGDFFSCWDLIFTA